MKLRKINLNDFEEIVDMYYAFCKEVFGDKRKISPKYFYYKKVMDWINSDKHIIIASREDGTIAGMTISHIDGYSGLTEPVYTSEVAYVKPEFRNTKAAYMLFKNVDNMAKELKLNLVTSGRINNGTSSIMKKHFDLKEQTISFEGVFNEQE